MYDTKVASLGPCSSRAEALSAFSGRSSCRLISIPAFHALTALVRLDLNAPPPSPERMAEGKRGLLQLAERKRAQRLGVAAASVGC